MTRFPGARAAVAALIAPLLIYMGAASPASAMQILDAADHGELAAAIAAGEVSRIAVAGDRVKKVIRAGGGLRVEHDAASGDLYLTPAGVAHDGEAASLFIVTEKGFTYRLTLTPVWDGAAQILIRNPAAISRRGNQPAGRAHRRAGGAGARGGAARAAGGLRHRGRRRRAEAHRDLAGAALRGARRRGRRRAGCGGPRRDHRPGRGGRVARDARHRALGGRLGVVVTEPAGAAR